MKFYLTLLILFVTTASNCQINNNSIPDRTILNTVPDFKLLDCISTIELAGRFAISNGLIGVFLKLDSNGKFTKEEFGCMGSRFVDSGRWEVKDNKTLILKSKKQIQSFDIVYIGNLYILIEPRERKTFVNDFYTSKTGCNKCRPFTIHDRTYSVAFLIAFELGKKYFMRDLLEN